MPPFSVDPDDPDHPVGLSLPGARRSPWDAPPPDPSTDPAVILAAALSPLFAQGQVVELRVLNYTRDGRFPKTVSGYFDQAHLVNLAAAALAHTVHAPGVYYTLNQLDPAVLARRVNRIDTAEKGGTSSDSDVRRRRWLPVDVDPVRPSGVCATDAEKAAAGAVAAAVLMYLQGLGWPDPIVIDSGNGRHLLYRIDLPADDGGRVERALKALAARFDTDAVKIDTSVHNPARIMRLPGTQCRKGDSTADRPHRPCQFLSAPPDTQPVPVELLERLVAEAPAGGKKTVASDRSPTAVPRGAPQSTGRLDVPAWLTARGVPFTVADKPTGDGRTVYKLAACPFDPSHADGEAAVMQAADGTLSANCFHASCAGKGWGEFKAAIGPPKPDHVAKAAGGRGGAGRGIRSRRMDQIQPRTVRWLWKGRVAYGHVTLIAGRQGVSKSLVTLSLAAAVSTGGTLPGGEPCEPGTVFLLSAEDDAETVLRPRLIAAGADASRIELLEGEVTTRPDGSEVVEPLTAASVDALRETLRRAPDCRLLIIDPVGDYVGGRVDIHRDNEVRGALNPLRRLAAELGIAVVLVAHLRKTVAETADAKVLGSVAFTAVARTVLHVAPDPEDADRRLLLAGKTNLGRKALGLAYRLEPVGDEVRVAWEPDPVEMTADDLYAEAPPRARGNSRGPKPNKLDEAKDWLEEALATGPRPSAELLVAAATAGLTEKTVRKAMAKLGVTSSKSAFGGGWSWSLPDLTTTGMCDETPAASDPPAPQGEENSGTFEPAAEENA